MKKVLSILIVSLLLILVGCGTSTIIADYGDAESFETALNNGENLEGKIVNIKIANVETQSVYGYNLWAGEHLNFVSEKNPNVSTGDTISVKITEVKSALGSWIIKYEKVGNATITDATITSK